MWHYLNDPKKIIQMTCKKIFILDRPNSVMNADEFTCPSGSQVKGG